jgi:hypothetical protein
VVSYAPREETRDLGGKRVTVYDYPDGRMEIRHQGRALPYRTFDLVRRIDQGAVVENKRLTEALELCRRMQADLPPLKRSVTAPRRSAQGQHIFTQL